MAYRTRHATNALIMALEMGVLSWEKVARECLSYMSESDVDDMSRVAEFVSLTVPEGAYRCDDGSGESDIEADSAQEAAEQYARECDYEIDRRSIFVVVNTEDFEGDTDSFTVVLDPEEPECEEGYTHDWRRTAVQGNGGGTLTSEECRWCGVQRTSNTWATNPSDGTQGHRTIEYAEPHEDFSPRALGCYPFASIRIGDGDRVRLDWIHYTVRSDEDQVCGWTAVRDHDGAEFPLASIGTWESWRDAHVCEPEPNGVKEEYKRLLTWRWDTVWLGDEGIDGVHVLTHATWPMRGCFRAEAPGHIPVYLWQDCEGDAAEEYATLFPDIKDPDDIDVRSVYPNVRDQLVTASLIFLGSL
jgi:hypothetical protein